MKKLFCFSLLSVCLPFAAQALEMTHPFYLSPEKTLTSTTTFAWEKFHVKDMINGYQNYRTRDIIAAQAFSYGVAPKVAIDAVISNAWNRLKYDGTNVTDGEDTNIDWQLGATYDLYKTETTYVQTRLAYLQKETHHAGGAYKAFNLHARAGYDLKFVLPYIGASAELPLFQHKFADNNPKYDIMAGLYKSLNQLIAVDATFHYNYDKLWKSKKLYATADLYTFVTDWLAVGGGYSYTFQDNGKNNAHGDGHTLRVQIKTVF